MELSLSKTTEAKKLKTDVGFMVFADLLSIGYSEMDAYTIAFPEDKASSIQYQTTKRKTTVESARFKQILEERRKKNSSYLSVPSEAAGITLINAEQVAKEILMSAQKQPVGSKERADLMAKYNDIRKENEQTANDTTEAINFYFPVKCQQCPLFYAYNEQREEQGEEEIRPVEMEGIIRKADKIIREATEE